MNKEIALKERPLKECPLCGETEDIQINRSKVYKPEIVCNNCGIALQGETELEAIESWNRPRLPEQKENER